ncbi:hypothetical protein HZB78_00680 [Candidatus Collierbacteria bacterium]|nr:hypothetical protein [Candidatus Collierbacteria bacterium]
MSNTNELSQYWRSWLVRLTQADKFDPIVTGKLAEVVGRRALDLTEVEKRIFGLGLEEEIFAVLAANPFAALRGDRAIDPLIADISNRTRRDFNTGARAVIASELALFSDGEWTMVQAFLDRQLPVDASIIEVKQ